MVYKLLSNRQVVFSENRAPPKLDGWLSFCLLKLPVYRLYSMYQIIVGQYPITSSSLLAISLFSISFQYKTILHQHQLCYSTIKCNWLHWTNIRSPWNIPHLTWLQKYLYTYPHEISRWVLQGGVPPVMFVIFTPSTCLPSASIPSGNAKNYGTSQFFIAKSTYFYGQTMEHHHFSWLNQLFLWPNYGTSPFFMAKSTIFMAKLWNITIFHG